jgi:hypothetical protein
MHNQLTTNHSSEAAFPDGTFSDSAARRSEAP